MHLVFTWLQELEGLSMEQLLERLEAEKAKHRAVLDEVCRCRSDVGYMVPIVIHFHWFNLFVWLYAAQGMSRTVSTFALIVFLAICNAAKYAAM